MVMGIDNRTIDAWAEVHRQLRMILEKEKNAPFAQAWMEASRKSELANNWFTQDQNQTALNGLVNLLSPESLDLFQKRYLIESGKTSKDVGVIMAGNIPAAGFHDLLCVSLSRHRLSAKLSSSDKHLLPFVLEVLRSVDVSLADNIRFVENLKNVDAVIATGSDNSARYFDYYFGNKPHVFRRNRNSIAILSGTENEFDLMLLGKDIFTYFGLGCRSVSKLFVPEGYSFDMFFEAMLQYESLLQHTRYMNNHDYHQAIYLMNNEPFLTNNFLIIKEDSKLSSPVGVLYYETYKNESELKEKIESIQDRTQCIISKNGPVKPGQSQTPGIFDFPDGVDTLKFLSSI